MSTPLPPDGSNASCSSLAAIAEVAGVSRMTVSRVLRNAGYTAADTRARVLAVAEKLGYRPNPLVSALMTQIHHGKLPQLDNVIAYLTNSAVRGGWRENETYAQMFDGAAARAFQCGYRLEEFWMGERGFSSARMSRVLYTRGIRGVIVGPMMSAHGHLNLKWGHFSAVAIAYSLLRPELDRVSNDQYNSTLTAMRELRRLGYRRIGMAIHNRVASRVHYRWPAAFLMHQRRHGSVDETLLYLPEIWRRESFCEWVRQARPDALVIAEPNAYPWLVEAGYRVPEDIAVANLDRLPQQTFWAGIDQHSAAVGAAAVDRVIERVNSNDLGIPGQARIVELPGKWIAGPSVRPAAPRLPETGDNSISSLETVEATVGKDQ
jgi:LacI family transcriptional regulator